MVLTVASSVPSTSARIWRHSGLAVPPPERGSASAGACRPPASGPDRRAGRRPRPPARRASGGAGRGRRSGRRRRPAPAGRGAGCARRKGREEPERRRCRPALGAGHEQLVEVFARRERVANQRRLPAADSITDIMCHRPGTAWQKAWTRPRGSNSGRSVLAKTTPDVPSESAMVPGSTAPTPTPFADWSPPPATTGVPATQTRSLRPAASVRRRRSPPVPRRSAAATGGMPSAASTSGDQSRAARSNSSVPGRRPCPSRARRSAGRRR